MANEKQVEGKNVLGLVLESSRGVDPGTLSFTGGNSQVATGISTKAGPRGHLAHEVETSPNRAGLQGSPDTNEYVYRGKCYVYPVEVVDATSRPLNWEHLLLAGFDPNPTYDPGPPKTLTGKLLDFGHPTLTAHRYTLSTLGPTQAWLYKLHGLVGNCKLSWSESQALALEVLEARGSGGSRNPSGSGAGTVSFVDTNNNRRLPFYGKSATLSVVDSDATPYTLVCHSGELSFNNLPQETVGLSADGDPADVDADAQPLTGTFSFYAVPQGDLDPWDLWQNQKWLDLSLEFTSVDRSGNDELTLSNVWELTGVNERFVNKKLVWDFQVRGLYPDDATDVARTANTQLTYVYTSN